MKTEQIKQIVDQVDVKNPKTVQEAARKLIESAIDLSAGTEVTLVDEDGAGGTPYPGVRGRVKGPSTKTAGWYDVEFPDGSVHACQADLLVPVK